MLIFSGLTAYDVQRIRQMGMVREGAAILGALMLYLDFLNLGDVPVRQDQPRLLALGPADDLPPRCPDRW